MSSQFIKSCLTCDFNFGGVCAGHGLRPDNNLDTYGMSIDESSSLFPSGCQDYDISFSEFSKLCDNHDFDTLTSLGFSHVLENLKKYGGIKNENV